MLRDILTVGEKIDVKQLDKDGIPVKATNNAFSQLFDIIDETTLSIAVPLRNKTLVKLHPGISYQLCFYTIKGLYQCTCTMLKIYKENNANIVMVRLTSELEKFQRRKYYRMEVVHEIVYRVVPPEETILRQKLLHMEAGDSEERTKVLEELHLFVSFWQKAAITDISGGGAKFNSSEQLSHGDRVEINLEIMTNGEINKLLVCGEIIVSEKLINVPGKYEHRMEFVGISHKDRENIIKYIFEQERYRMKNNKV